MNNIYKNYIAGEWVAGDATTINHNPSDLDNPLGEYAQATPQQAKEAVDAAYTAAPIWRNTSPQVRFQILDKIGDTILQRKDELAKLLANEEGKIFSESQGEVTRAGMIFKYFAGEALRMHGDSIDSVRAGVECLVNREPLGVVAIITPWNFPIAVPAWKIAPALAYGNTVVFKPAEIVPGCAWELANIISQAIPQELPKGIFNLVMGKGRDIGNAWFPSHENLQVGRGKIAALTFTGSAETGHYLAKVCAQNMIRVQLEMGGKNPLIVLDDADINIAVDCAINGAFYSTGQRCTASSPLIVSRGIYSKFLDLFMNKTKHLEVGHALDPNTHIGPVVDSAQLQSNLKYVAIGVKEGAKLLCGGGVLKKSTRGHFMQPVIFSESTNEMQINREEIFGPVASIIKANDYEEAINIANSSQFGLSAGIVTNSHNIIKHFKRNIRAGMVMINLPTAGVDYHVPFGGLKSSSYGAREQGRQAIEFYTTTKTVYIN
jgi:acyl-CoA reductase-like NAD-dependent aldehyde dehydrogenase